MSDTLSVKYSGDRGFRAALEQLGVSALVSTYEHGHVVSVGLGEGGRCLARFARVPRPMGLSLGKNGTLAVASQSSLDLYRALPKVDLGAGGNFDVLFVPDRSWFTGKISAHDLAVTSEHVFLVNTAFSCLMKFPLDGRSPSVHWKPSFVSALSHGDRCHFNGLAMDGDLPAYATVIARTDMPGSWREHKREGGCIIDLRTDQVLVEGLSMPHSPRLKGSTLYYINSGVGALCAFDTRDQKNRTITCELPGFGRGLAIVGNYAFVATSLARETKAFGDLEITASGKTLKCGVLIVDLRSGQHIGFFEFTEGVKELFEVRVVRAKNALLVGPNMETDGFGQTFLLDRRLIYVGPKAAE